MNAIFPPSIAPPLGIDQKNRITPRAGFSIDAGSEASMLSFLRKDPYSAALEYLRGDVAIHGDLVAAIHYYSGQRHSALRLLVTSLIAKAVHSPVTAWFSRCHRPASDIAFHYDLSNDFYAQFLDPRMVYSCAYFRDSWESVDQAQMAKLDHICRKLELQPTDRLLDVGCGWGSLLIHGARYFGASGEGYTLSHEQAEFGQRAVSDCGLASRVRVLESDYREAKGPYTKIASIGMFEHLGRSRLREYFRRIYSVLDGDGLFLNHGIVRPDGISVDAETLFLDRHVFPGSGLVSLADVIAEASRAGFETVDVENLRPHYALTCRAWVQRLQSSEAKCIALVGEVTYRTWLLYLAASAANFEDGFTEIHQVLFAKRGSHGRRWLTREFLYSADNPTTTQRPLDWQENC